MDRQRVLTGERPTGRLHLGHYVGSLESRVRLQDEYDCFFLIADYRALGDHLDDIEAIHDSVFQVALDWLAVGLDPERSTFVVHSYVPEHAELAMLLGMLTPLGMLQRNPTLKAETALLGAASLSVGFFTYPVSQVADILLAKADLVPAGEDQLPHIEMTREVARRFNARYGPVFPIPAPLVGRVPRLPGTDGQGKMGKTPGNAIWLSDGSDEVTRKVMGMYTDPTRLRATDPGHVEGNPVFAYHDASNPDRGEVDEMKERYRRGRVGDVEVKRHLAVALNDFLEPIRRWRGHYESRPTLVRDILENGSRRARAIAQDTTTEVRDAMGIAYLARK